VLGIFDLDNKQDIFSVIGGVDFGAAAVFGPNDALVAQAMGGYLQSTLSFNGSPTSFNFSGATAGAGLTYLNSGFFADALFKADLLSYQTSFPTLATFGAGQANGTATSLGGLANIGYRRDFVDGLFHFNEYIEPIGTLSYVSTQFDTINLAGATANFQNGESFRGALGLRVGSIFLNTPTYEADASITGKYWRQFETVNGVTLADAGPDLTLNDPYPRQFGEVAGQINVTNKGSGWSAFANAYTKFATDFTIVGVKGGVRYQW
jgi:outer membrane autotransporter protein